ncbi:MAG: transcription termination/antitermination protein NusA, partial [Pyramidobacter sp.]|nr:transcription termination/antitermination protein NusA [Pyramidobacter sp.]
EYIKNALSPAKVISVERVPGQDKTAKVYAPADQLSLAIGKAGQNVRLAARLTGWKIDINAVEGGESAPAAKAEAED